ncbi:glycosyltransferase family 2 protein [Microbulbifer sp. TRSA005]|uniref:glycosyltransferase family 2 protein n=1 Tax=Microbulbifer sp. TRSA005 TaxID=3243383 RepID=UPI0040395D6F
MISVIVTAYNIEKYIDDCLQSVLNQTLTDIEVIVVDDGSTDSTPELIQKYALKDERIIPVLLPENTPGGVAVAANIGLRKASREFVGFVDGDDWCEPFMFERLVTAAQNSGAEVTIGKFKNFDEEANLFYDASDEKYWGSESLPLNTAISGLDVRKKVLKLNPVPWRKLYLRSFLVENDIFFPEGDYFYEDNPFHWYCVISARNFTLIDDYICHHRMNRVGQTMSAGDGRLLAMYEHHNTIFEWLHRAGEYAKYKNELILWVINNSCWIYEAIKDELKPKVLESLAGALLRHDVDTVVRVTMSDYMGGGGRNLVRDALEITGNKKLAKKIKSERGVLTRAIAYFRKEGFFSTAKQAARFFYHKSPPAVKVVIDKGRAVTTLNVRSNDQVMNKLRSIENKMTLQGYLLALNDEFEKDVRKELAEIKSVLADIQELSKPK